MHTLREDRPPAAWITLAALAGLSMSIGHTNAPAGAGSPASPDAVHDVAIGSYFFVPNFVTAEVGDSVRWLNGGNESHSAVAKDNPPRWDSGALAPGTTFTWTFSEPGYFEYECTLHPGLMEGTIVVEGPTPTSTATEPGPAARRPQQHRRARLRQDKPRSPRHRHRPRCRILRTPSSFCPRCPTT